MKVGTDGVLLGAWAELKGKNFLDVGTGTGLVALMMAQRTVGKTVTAVELDADAAAQAAENFEKSPWKTSLTVVCADVKSFVPAEPFDTIVSNPPFYVNSPATQNERRDKARQTDTLKHSELIDAVNRLLATDGVFSVVLPTSAAEDFCFDCWQKNLFLKRRMSVQTKEKKEVKRVLLTFCRKQMKPEESNLCMMDVEGKKTPEYQNLTKDFYL